MALPLLAIPATVIIAAKGYLAYRGAECCMRALNAGVKAHFRGEDVIDAAMEAGASSLAASILYDFLNARWAQ